MCLYINSFRLKMIDMEEYGEICKAYDKAMKKTRDDIAFRFQLSRDEYDKAKNVLDCKNPLSMWVEKRKFDDTYSKKEDLT